jgi:hypothetical protein
MAPPLVTTHSRQHCSLMVLATEHCGSCMPQAKLPAKQLRRAFAVSMHVGAVLW